MAKKNLDNVYISSFCMELYLILQAGIPVNSGISMLMEDENDNFNKELLAKINERMELGGSLSKALGETEGFPAYMVKMIDIGEETGNLDSVLKALASYYTRQEQIYQSIKNAVAYPSILVIMMLFVIIIVITKVLPIFNDVFAQLGATMGAFATSIMNIGVFINNNSLLFIAVIAAIAALLLYLFIFEKGQKKLVAFLGNGKIGDSVATAHFAAAMSMAMQSGLDIDASLDMADDLCSGTVVSKKIENCRNFMSQGEAFYAATLKAKLFPSLYCQMLKIGFKTGSADTVMEEIAIRTEEAINDKIENLIGRVEPTLVIVMSVIVGLILVSVMLPLMSIMSTIG